MGNLVSEYRRRHNLNFIWACNDGVCFFNKDRKPFAGCVISDAPRSLNNCITCRSNRATLVCDIFMYDKNINKVIFIDHIHILADEDIYEVMLGYDNKLIPYFARNCKDIEVWLWNLFLRTSPFANRYNLNWNYFLNNQNKEKQSNVQRAFAQMLWCAEAAPNVMHLYYDHLYQPIIIGRNYLLIK